MRSFLLAGSLAFLTNCLFSQFCLTPYLFPNNQPIPDSITNMGQVTVCQGEPYTFLDSLEYSSFFCHNNIFKWFFAFAYYDSLNPFDNSIRFYDTIWNPTRVTINDFPTGSATLTHGYIDSAGNQFRLAVYMGFINIVACSPVADLSYSKDSICTDACVVYTDKSRHIPTSYHWIFEGGNPREFYGKVPPAICYENTGTYNTSIDLFHNSIL